MFKVMNFSRTLTVAAIISGLSGVAAHAEDLRIRVGDLSQTNGVRAFNQRVEAASRSLCAGYPLADLARHSACEEAVRREAVAQLTPIQRAELETPNRAMAMAAAGSH